MSEYNFHKPRHFVPGTCGYVELDDEQFAAWQAAQPKPTHVARVTAVDVERGVVTMKMEKAKP